MFGIEEITSIDQLSTLRPAWEKLIEENGTYSCFLSYEWFHCCLTAYRKEMLVLAVKEGSRVICIAPLCRCQDSFRGIRVRKIEFITNPDTAVADFIVSKDRREESIRAIVDYLFSQKRSSWDVLVLNRLPAESENYVGLKKALQDQNKKYFEKVSSFMPYIPIKGGWESFLQTRSVRFKKTHRNIINRVNKLGKMEIQYFHEDATGDVFKEILAVSEKSWKAKPGISISSWKEARQFFQAFTGLAGNRGWLLIWLLKMDGNPIAMEYDLECLKKVYALRADYDEKYKDHSPGAYLEYHIIKHLFDEGYKEYNAGPGIETYKLRWTDQLKENVALYICNETTKGWMIWILECKLIPLLKQIRYPRGKSTWSDDIKDLVNSKTGSLTLHC